MNYDDQDDQDSFNEWMNSTPKPKPKLFSTTEEESYGPKPTKTKPIQYDEDGEEIEDDGYRKPFSNPTGRPVNDNLIRSDVMASMKMTFEQHKFYISLGGSSWLKEQLGKAVFERDKCARLKEKDRVAIKRAARAAKLALKKHPVV